MACNGSFIKSQKLMLVFMVPFKELVSPCSNRVGNDMIETSKKMY